MFGEDMNLGRQVHVPAFTISTVDKLSNPVFCSKRPVHFQTLLNIFKFADFITFRFVLLSVHQVKADFILILALASNNLSVCVCHLSSLGILPCYFTAGELGTR